MTDSIRPCVKGHTAPRYKNGRCSLCSREYAAKTIEARRVRDRGYYAANAKTLNQSSAKYRAANRQTENERYSRWNRENPAGAAAKRHKRRCLLISVGGTIEAHEITALIERQGHRCAGCTQRSPLTLDHIIPVSRGGLHVIQNAQMLCRPCNSRKSNTDPIVHAQRQGRLL